MRCNTSSLAVGADQPKVFVDSASYLIARARCRQSLGLPWNGAQPPFSAFSTRPKSQPSSSQNKLCPIISTRRYAPPATFPSFVFTSASAKTGRTSLSTPLLTGQPTTALTSDDLQLPSSSLNVDPLVASDRQKTKACCLNPTRHLS
jgi:hypothetical protein